MADFFIMVYPFNWYVFIILGALLGLTASYFTKDYKNYKELLKSGILGIISGLAIEIVGVALGLWTYTGGNWPVMLWVSYFVNGIAWVQIVKVLQKKNII